MMVFKGLYIKCVHWSIAYDREKNEINLNFQQLVAKHLIIIQKSVLSAYYGLSTLDSLN